MIGGDESTAVTINATPKAVSYNDQNLSVGQIVYQVAMPPVSAQIVLLTYEIANILDNNVIEVKNLHSKGQIKVNANRVHTDPKALTEHYISMYTNQLREEIPKRLQELYRIQRDELGMPVLNFLIDKSTEI